MPPTSSPPIKRRGNQCSQLRTLVIRRTGTRLFPLSSRLIVVDCDLGANRIAFPSQTNPANQQKLLCSLPEHQCTLAAVHTFFLPLGDRRESLRAKWSSRIKPLVSRRENCQFSSRGFNFLERAHLHTQCDRRQTTKPKMSKMCK